MRSYARLCMNQRQHQHGGISLCCGFSRGKYPSDYLGVFSISGSTTIWAVKSHRVSGFFSATCRQKTIRPCPTLAKQERSAQTSSEWKTSDLPVRFRLPGRQRPSAARRANPHNQRAGNQDGIGLAFKRQTPSNYYYYYYYYYYYC